MAILEGGIFSNPRGKTGGIVFGAARTRTGKKVTSRLLVPPSNPNTAAQQIQRGKFAEALAVVRLIGNAIYQGDFNRAIGQLPGFQSLTSIYLTSIDASDVFLLIPPINLGSLHKPLTFTTAGGVTAQSLVITGSTELGLNGTDADVAVCIIVMSDPAASPLERDVVVDLSNTRSDMPFDVVVGDETVEYGVLLYFRGAGDAEGLLSPTSWATGSSSAA